MTSPEMLSKSFQTIEYFHQVVRIDKRENCTWYSQSCMTPPQLKVRRRVAVERHSPGALKQQTDAGCQF
jgi:hypothetical protein